MKKIILIATFAIISLNSFSQIGLKITSTLYLQDGFGKSNYVNLVIDGLCIDSKTGIIQVPVTYFKYSSVDSARIEVEPSGIINESLSSLDHGYKFTVQEIAIAFFINYEPAHIKTAYGLIKERLESKGFSVEYLK